MDASRSSINRNHFHSHFIWNKTIMDVSIVTSFLLLLVVTCALKLLNWIWLRPRKLEKMFRKQGMKGNSYRLIVGDAKEFMSLMITEQTRSIQLTHDITPHIFPYQDQIIRKHGENSFMWLGPSPHLLITDPQMIHQIFTNPETFQKPVPNPIGEILGQGLPFLEGDHWTVHRKIIQPVFRVENLKNMTSSIGLSCSIMVDRWESLVSNAGKSCQIDVWPFLSDFTGDVISRTAFGSTYEQGRRIFVLQKEQTELFMKHLTYSYVPGFRYIPTKANRRLKAISKEIKSILRGMISKREKAMVKGETSSNDLLGLLMESNYKEIQEHGNMNKGISVDGVIEECRLFYFSGSDTTSVLLVWTMVLLSKHQEWQARAREEVLHIFGKNEPTFDDLSRLKVVNMILQEVLRLYPPVPGTLRAPIRTTKLGKLTIPAGAILMILIGLIHHNPKIWGDDTKEFKPERFSEGMASATNAPFSFIPFASGPRVCIGQQFAMIEAKMALAMILQRFTFELSPSYQHAPFGIMTLQPQYGAPLIFNKI